MWNFFNDINFNLEAKYNFKIVEEDNTDYLIRNLIDYENNTSKKSIRINENTFSIRDCLIISNLSYVSDILNSISKSWIQEKINNNENWNTNIILDQEKVDTIIEQINLKIGFEYLFKDIDNNKLIKSIFTINEKLLISKNNLLNILDILSSSNFKPLIIVKNLTYINIEELIKYSNLNFLILTSDFTKYIQSYNQLELVSFYNGEILFDIKSCTPIINFFENIKNKEIKENENFFLNKEEEKQFKFNFFDIKKSFFE
ncbi:hypothetical protein [Mycoplasmopsis arginini]|uniref:hypothetical protein n=1 Tax=Mycoplasmopsis arginini TaxID=2094 RepID=UPI0005C266BA|nr:hypothetical protein [Mycoplasmopsis arginini]MCY2902955.1 hypothetical protein [Mycoplasmopsis arginini QMP CG1-2758]MDI3348997.1 hypothetical protein [Mycoplasmopsis arginini]MDI3350116.1 hypothetical protein [Mycoplasmopsis arginini]MDI3350683.1 hypothetical protein [Mycoplasmopsis arginini]MDI3351237.1 hypothetical protein [Mycoplasmopsis arginini]